MLWEDNNNIFSSIDSEDEFFDYAEEVICTLFQMPKADTYDFYDKISIDYVYAVLVLLYFENNSAFPVDIFDLNYGLNNFEETKEDFKELRQYSIQRILIDKNCEKNLFDVLDDEYDFRSLCRAIGFRFNAWVNGMRDFTDYSYINIT